MRTGRRQRKALQIEQECVSIAHTWSVQKSHYCTLRSGLITHSSLKCLLKFKYARMLDTVATNTYKTHPTTSIPRWKSRRIPCKSIPIIMISSSQTLIWSHHNLDKNRIYVRRISYANAENNPSRMKLIEVHLNVFEIKWFPLAPTPIIITISAGRF